MDLNYLFHRQQVERTRKALIRRKRAWRTTTWRSRMKRRSTRRPVRTSEDHRASRRKPSGRRGLGSKGDPEMLGRITAQCTLRT